MGYGSFDHEAARTLNVTRTAKGIDAFAHNAAIQKGEAVRGTHPLMNIYNRIRESRDSDAHPESNAVLINIDVTGSMSEYPRIAQAALSPLMSQIVDNDYLAHPQILISATGDGYGDRAPFQCGQFESDNLVDSDFGRLYLEGNGQGSGEESYEYAAYMMAYHASIDCFEKRQKRGYAFMFGDELSYDTLEDSRAVSIFGGEINPAVETMDVQELFELARQKFDIFFCIPAGTSGAMNANVFSHWQRRVGVNRTFRLSDPSATTAFIASAIGVAEGCTFEEVEQHMRSVEQEGGAYNDNQVRAVLEALQPMGTPTAEARSRRSGRGRQIIR